MTEPKAPKAGTCYCGCNEATGSWFKSGHGMRAAASVLQGSGLTGSAAAEQLKTDYGSVVDGVVALRA